MTIGDFYRRRFVRGPQPSEKLQREMKRQRENRARHVAPEEPRRGHRWVEAVACMGSIAGAILNATGQPGLLVLGYWIWLPTNVLWIALAWRWQRWGMLALFIFYLVMCVVGLMTWGSS